MNALIEALCEPARYPHPVDTVTVRQTHLSWVLLAGEYAYKIKKPVRYEFVDFTSLQRRRQACEDELRLNRRFAPSLYVDVVTIRGTARQPLFQGDSAPLEYAVRLRRFAAEQQLEALLQRAAVSCEELWAFGQQLAGLHEDCPVYRPPAAAQRLLGIVTANLDELQAVREAAPVPDWQELLPGISQWLQERTVLVAGLVEQRAAQGRIRECHGDLHAGNVVRFEGRLIAFDCLEFDIALRRIDVLDDVAFLFMDLSARGRRDLAYAFLNGWLEASGDHDGVALLDVFFVHRALVRAKVHKLGGQQFEVRRYVAAVQACRQGRSALLLLTCGLSGSGKSWLSERLMAGLGAIRIRSDVERKRLAGLQAGQSSAAAGIDIYTAAFNELVYARLRQLAGEQLRAGQSVIIDAACLKQAERQGFIALANTLQLPIVVLHCVAPQEELQRRLSRRRRAGKDASEADEAVMHRQLRVWEPFSDIERPLVIEVDTRQPGIAAQLAASIASR